MAREIKFRAWAISEKKMCPVTTITDRGAFLVGIEPMADQYLDSGKFVIESCKEGRCLNNGEFELMQFTGLRDRNGKEIYEGDILNKKTTFDNNMADRRFQPATQINVGFENGFFIDKNTNLNLFDAMLTVSSFPQKSWTNYEIIGNEFENPELI